MKIKDIGYKLIVTAIVAVFVLGLYAFDIPCVFLHFTGLKCPGCGMTRAVLAALMLDFEEAFVYNKMFWSLPFLFLCFLCDGKIFKNKWLNITFYVLILAGFATNVLFC